MHDLGEYRSARERGDWRGAWAAAQDIAHPDLRAATEREWWRRMDPKKVAQDAVWWVRPTGAKARRMRAIEVIDQRYPFWVELGQRRILDPQIIERVDMDAVRHALCEQMMAYGVKRWEGLLEKDHEILRDLRLASQAGDADQVVSVVEEWVQNVREFMTQKEVGVYNFQILPALNIMLKSMRRQDISAFAMIETMLGEQKANAVWAQLVFEAVKEKMR